MDRQHRCEVFYLMCESECVFVSRCNAYADGFQGKPFPDMSGGETGRLHQLRGRHLVGVIN